MWTVSPIYERHYSFAIGKDITQKKTDELILIKRNRQLKLAQQIAGLGYWTFNILTKKAEWSQEMYAIWDREPGRFEITLENLLEAIYPEDRYLFSKKPENYFDIRNREIEHRIISPGGHIKWVSLKINLVKNAQGKPVRLEGVAQDVTEKKRLESEKELILESITDGFFAVDNRWQVTYWNRAAENILKIPKEHVLHRDLWEATESHIRLKPFDEFYRALKFQETRIFETNLSSIGLWVEISIFPKQDGMSVYLKDITERKQYQREIFRIVQETQEKERSRIGRDLHDGLTQSLTAIKMNLSHFMDKLVGGEVRLNLMTKSLTYLEDAIEESRNISHGLLSLTLDNFGLIAALKEIADSINTANQVKVTFNHHLDETRPLAKELEVNIYRIVQEGMNNMLKHSKATEAEIVLLQGSESIQLIIRDNGVGLKGEKTGAEPLGAGLQNIKVRVYGLDGKLKFISSEGNGFQVHITFPVSQLNR